jgi:hypothetical protein
VFQRRSWETERYLEKQRSGQRLFLSSFLDPLPADAEPAGENLRSPLQSQQLLLTFLGPRGKFLEGGSAESVIYSTIVRGPTVLYRREFLLDPIKETRLFNLPVP